MEGARQPAHVRPLRSERYPDQQDRTGGPQRNAGRYVNMTQWDGYQAERREIVDHLQANGIADVMAIAGDTHFWTTSEVPTDWDDPGAPYVLTEFGGSSISSANAGEMTDLPGNDLIRPVVAKANPLSLRFMEVATHGYGLIDLSAERASVTYRSPATIAQPTSTTSVLARFEVDRGTARVRQVEGDGFMPRVVDGVVDPPIDPTDPPANGGAGADGGGEPRPRRRSRSRAPRASRAEPYCEGTTSIGANHGISRQGQGPSRAGREAGPGQARRRPGQAQGRRPPA